MKHHKHWRLIAKALGEKTGKNDKEADRIAFIRLGMFLSLLITNCFIVANTVRHWNDLNDDTQVSSSLCTTEKEKIIETNRRRFPYD